MLPPRAWCLETDSLGTMGPLTPCRRPSQSFEGVAQLAQSAAITIDDAEVAGSSPVVSQKSLCERSNAEGHNNQAVKHS